MDLGNAPFFLMASYGLSAFLFLLSIITVRKTLEIPAGWIFRITWIAHSLWIGVEWIESKPIVFPVITAPGSLGIASWSIGLALIVSEIRFRVRWNGFLASWTNAMLLVLVFVLKQGHVVDSIDLLKDSGWHSIVTTLTWISYGWFFLAGGYALLQLVFDRVPMSWYRMGFVALGLLFVFPAASHLPAMQSGKWTLALYEVPFGQALFELAFVSWLIFVIPRVLGGLIRVRWYQRVSARLYFVTDWFYRIGILMLFVFLGMTLYGAFGVGVYPPSHPPIVSVIVLMYLGLVAASSFLLRNRIRLEPELPPRDALDAWAFVSMRTGYLILTASVIVSSVWSFLAVGQLWMRNVFGVAPVLVWLFFSAYIHFRSERQTVDYHHAVWTLWGVYFVLLSSEWLWRLSTL